MTKITIAFLVALSLLGCGGDGSSTTTGGEGGSAKATDSNKQEHCSVDTEYQVAVVDEDANTYALSNNTCNKVTGIAAINNIIVFVISLSINNTDNTSLLDLVSFHEDSIHYENTKYQYDFNKDDMSKVVRALNIDNPEESTEFDQDSAVYQDAYKTVVDLKNNAIEAMQEQVQLY